MSWDEPQTLAEALDLARTLSESSLLPAELAGKPANVLLVIGYAKSLRLSPFVALRIVQVIKGRPTLSADGLAAVVRGSGKVEILDVIESTDERCVVRARRQGSAIVEITWDLGRAAKAGLKGGQWSSYPRQMLRARAMAEACRLMWPDVVGGIYEPSEIQAIDITPQEQEPPRSLPSESKPEPPKAEPAKPEPWEVAELKARIVDIYDTKDLRNAAWAACGAGTPMERLAAFGKACETDLVALGMQDQLALERCATAAASRAQARLAELDGEVREPPVAESEHVGAIVALFAELTAWEAEQRKEKKQ